MTPIAWCSIFVAYGLLLLLLALPMALGKVPPNAAYGFRTSKALGDSALWYAANRVAGRNLGVAGLLVAACAIGGALFGLPDWLNLAALVLGPAVACAHASWFARKAARARGPEDLRPQFPARE